jgi:prevent-host-death family protein
MGERTIGIRELKAQLSLCVKQVKAGATLVITERGKPVGKLVPVGASVDERLQQLVESKVIAWSGRKPQPRVPTVQPVRKKGSKTVSELLLEDRG